VAVYSPYSGDVLSDFKRKIHIANWIIVALFFILFLRLFFLQILKGGQFLEFSEKNRINIKTVKALRGKILDRNGEVIADNRPSFDLALVRGYATEKPDLILNDVAEFLKWNMEDKGKQKILKTVYDTNRYDPAILKKDITRDELGSIAAREYWLNGVRILEQPVREYPYGALMSHVLGYLSEIDKPTLKKLKEDPESAYQLGDYIGMSGIEKLKEPVIRGIDGAIPFVEDARGREIGEEASLDLLPAFRKRDPSPGNNLYLTIDLKLQKIAEEAFDKAAGAAIAMDPNSGEILAMISRPSFYPGYFTRGVQGEYWSQLLNDPQKPLYDRGLRGHYPPGSTFKIITAIAALSEKVIDPNYKVFCKGSYRLGREVKRCWRPEGHGWQNLHDALVHSCDVYFYDVGRKVGIDRLAKYARLFGLGKETGIGMNHENSGLVPDSEWKKKTVGIQWVEGETMSVAVGQGYLNATPIQMARMLSALANGGKLWKSMIVKKVEDYSGNLMTAEVPQLSGETGVDKNVMDIVKNGLLGVVNEPGGTAYWTVRSKSVNIAGKTGTAQVAKLEATKGKGGELADHAWFICFAPYENPEIVVSVLVEHGGHGSSAAGPIAKKIIEGYIKLKSGINPEIKTEAKTVIESKIPEGDIQGD
jgi:penicillin-binding protein 2